MVQGFPVYELQQNDLICQANLYEGDIERGIRSARLPMVRCIHKASIGIGDAYFCRRHAAIIALNLALTETRDEKNRVSKQAGDSGPGPVVE